MFEKLAEDIYYATLIKLADANWLEKLAKLALPPIQGNEAFKDFVSGNSGMFFKGIRNAMNAGHFDKKPKLIERLHSFIHDNPSIKADSDALGFTPFLGNWLSARSQVIPKVTPRADAAHAKAVQRAVQKSRVQAATNGMPYMGAWVA